MVGLRTWVGSLLLRAPDSVRSVRHVPVLGDLIHRIGHRIFPRDEKVWVQIEAGPSRGLWIELNPRTGQNYLRGDAEAPVQRVLAERLQPGMVFYDLGANIGFFSILAGRAVGPSGVVLSFEPDPETAQRLRRNIERNNLQNVVIVPKGVWSTSGMHIFAAADVTSPDRGTGRFVDGDGEASTTLLECVALDDFVRDAPAPQAIKCDVEGAEMQVLRGADKVLREHRPWILCEMHGSANDRLWRRLLAGLGYDCQTVDDRHVLASPQEDTRAAQDA